MRQKLVLAVALLGLLGYSVEAAEIRLRESLLQQQQDKATITITAVVDHIGHSAHSLSSDCDLHVPMRSRDIIVPIMGELKNACSIKPPSTFNTFWAHAVYDETHGRAVEVKGVFRIWLEHPPTGTQFQSEDKRVEWYDNSNPDHMVEIHPITQIGSLEFIDHVSEITQGPSIFEGKKHSKLKTILKKDLEIKRMQV